MKYFKIFRENEFIGIARSDSFLTYQEQNNLLVITNEEIGQFVEYQGKLYRDTWMRPLPSRAYPYILALVYNITEEEYNILAESIEKEEEIIIETPSIFVMPEITNTPNISVDFVREAKLKEMSSICRTTIENGFDLELRGETHHFSLDTQDQLNLISLSAMAQTQEYIPYHADGESCIFYTAEEINAIIAAATQFKIYHTTYYNALKTYINSLETIEEIAAIEYGVEIPEEYKSDVLKTLEQ